MPDSIAPQQLAAHPTAVIIDVRGRPDDEQIPGSQRFDADALLANPELPPAISRDDVVVVYCGSGNTCRDVADALRERGYNASPLEGGYRAWREAGLPTEPRA